ncbi:MAG: nitrate reductase subunit beta, partial [Actinobacteria bacterium]|nr:nitrate reductase subunit beta [Actinomycetota bacterium]
NLFTVGDSDRIRRVLRIMLAVRTYKRRQSVDGVIDETTLDLLEEVGLTENMVEAIYAMTTTPTVDDRFVLPPYHREMSLEDIGDPLTAKGATGFGYIQAPQRGA